MWPDLTAYALPSLWLVFGTFLVAGTVKGVAGVGLPMTALGILTFQTDPRTAVILAIVPIFLANLWQFLRAGDVRLALIRYLPFMAMMVPGIPLTLIWSAGVSQSLLMGVLGAVFVVFVALNVTRWAPQLPDRYDLVGQLGFGLLAGVLGGLTSLWLPAIVFYLSSRSTAKDEFVRATGLLLFAGSVPLFIGYVTEGYLTGPLTLLSLGLMIPTIGGLVIGEQLRKRLSEDAFRKVLLFIFLLIGLNLIRRALTG